MKYHILLAGKVFWTVGGSQTLALSGEIERIQLGCYSSCIVEGQLWHCKSLSLSVSLEGAAFQELPTSGNPTSSILIIYYNHSSSIERAWA